MKWARNQFQKDFKETKITPSSFKILTQELHYEKIPITFIDTIDTNYLNILTLMFKKLR